jgi:ferredoxin
MCQVGCIACGLCTKQSDIFKLEDNLARLDYVRYDPSPHTEAAYAKCPTGTLVYRGKTAPAPRPPTPKPPSARVTT